VRRLRIGRRESTLAGPSTLSLNGLRSFVSHLPWLMQVEAA
jgi:hypothetical protein